MTSKASCEVATPSDDATRQPAIPPANRRLTRQEERELTERAQAGDRAASDELVVAHLAFVAKLAGKYACRGIPAEDLFNEGTLGLIEAVRRFDPSRGHRFLTYAVFWIRRAMLQALKQYGQPIRIPESQYRLRANGPRRPPLTVRAAPKAPQVLPIDRVGSHHTEMVGAGCVSLDQFIGNSESTALGDLLGEADPFSPETEMIRREGILALTEGMHPLTEVEQSVLRERFGLDGVQRRTLEQIGKDLGVTRERVRQIEIQARNKLRRVLRRKEVRESFLPSLMARELDPGSHA